MTCYEELKARGLIAQVTNEEEISKMINEGKAVFYIGFDPTADSLHVGHFMALCLMKRLQTANLDRKNPLARPYSTTAPASRSRWSVLSSSVTARPRW